MKKGDMRYDMSCLLINPDTMINDNNLISFLLLPSHSPHSGGGDDHPVERGRDGSEWCLLINKKTKNKQTNTQFNQITYKY